MTWEDMIEELVRAGADAEQLCLISDAPGGAIRYRISDGHQSHLTADPGEILRWALQGQATWLAVMHTHRTSIPPSRQDHAWTRRMRAAAKLVGVEFRAHLVVLPDGSVQSCDGSLRAS